MQFLDRFPEMEGKKQIWQGRMILTKGDTARVRQAFSAAGRDAFGQRAAIISDFQNLAEILHQPHVIIDLQARFIE
ncbi:MAG: hypothetical protein C6P37_10195 [Caldibacillus debilis]|jgi:hypothetical protein|uniref:Uncharacterized protein n=2 Tax=Caldibacillus debilis TaxID=301148 RepID=A0A3E0K3V7_9BACI|nr:hypothetical protein [Caldibacillus debilis]REJ27823.1 MAG: hypothetical protein C6P37_10195 [Caldibacillus debilis]